VELLSGYRPRPERQEARPAGRRPRPDSPGRHHQDAQRQRRRPAAVPCAGHLVAHHHAGLAAAGVQEPGGAGRREAQTSRSLRPLHDPARPAACRQDWPCLGERHLPGLHRGRGRMPRVRRREARRSDGAAQPAGWFRSHPLARRWARETVGGRSPVELPRGLPPLQVALAPTSLRQRGGGADRVQRNRRRYAQVVRGRLPVHAVRLARRRLPQDMPGGRHVGRRLRLRRGRKCSRGHLWLGEVARG